MNGTRLSTALAVAAAIVSCGPAHGQTVWTGPPITFTRPDFVDWTLPENQDRITDNVWITRASGQGIFNIRLESSFGPLSPADTEWAYGSAADWPDLVFRPWIQWHGQNPPSTIGQPAVVHLISEDIYIDIMFLSWTSGGGGGFSYIRSTLPAPPALLLLALGALPKNRDRHLFSAARASRAHGGHGRRK